jgi:hypothetical protein
VSEPTKVLIGVFGEGLPTHLYFPPGSLKPAEKILDAERQAREREATRAKLQALQDARS